MSGSTLNPRAYAWLYECNEVGFKYHANDISAAIAIEQLKVLDKENARRREIVDIYSQELKDVPGLVLLEKPEDRISSNHIFAIRVQNRDHLMDKLKQNDIHCGVHYRLNTRYPMYPSTQLPNAEVLENELLSLPLHLALTNDDIGRVITTIKSGW